MSLHSDTLSRFRVNQYLLLILNAACFVEVTNAHFNLWFDPFVVRILDHHYTTGVVVHFNSVFEQE
jgi:hypothetical protein